MHHLMNTLTPRQGRMGGGGVAAGEPRTPLPDDDDVTLAIVGSRYIIM